MHEGLCRELVEEIGLDVAGFETTLGYAFTYENDKTISIFQCYLIVVDDDPEIKLSWEHEKYAWLTAEEVLALEIRQPYPTILSPWLKPAYLSDGLRRRTALSRMIAAAPLTASIRPSLRNCMRSLVRA